MATFDVTVQNQEVQRLLNAVIARAGNPKPALEAIGEDIVERIKQRFQTSTDPDGNPWKPNSPVTLALYASGLTKGYKTKSGGLNARGEKKLAGKKPLIDTGELMRQVSRRVSGSTLTVTENPIYAAIQQFGGRAGRNYKVTIPARPSMPIRRDGSLYPSEKQLIIDALNDLLLDGIA